MRVLAGDVGGTSTRLALYEVSGGRPRALVRADARSRGHSDLASILARFEADNGTLAGLVACLGLPGPVVGRVVQTTNLPWTVDAEVLEARFGLARVVLMNDLEAAAWGIECLAADDLVVLQTGTPGVGGNRALIAAGTGLGEAGLAWDGTTWVPFATEGGHASFAPTSPREDELLRFARADLGSDHVSVERLLSGPGLVRVYRFELSREHREAPAWYRAAEQDGDPASAVAAAAAAKRCPAAVRALELFARLYGAEAGNLALKLMATGGVYVAGGVAPKIRAWLESPAFGEAFLAKGRMSRLLDRMPLRLVLDDGLALLGAARRAVRE